MRARVSVVLYCLVVLGAPALCQNDPTDAINKLFPKPPQEKFDDVPPGFEEVTEKPQGGFGALDKCGEGEGEGNQVCVTYYMCDSKTKTVIVDKNSKNTDGFGLIDIRFGKNSCPHPLDVCCNLPEKGLPPSTTESPKTPPPKPKPVVGKCGIRNTNGLDFKITGNKNNEAEYGEFPWMLAILKKNYDPSVDPVLAICGGSLIAPNVVLTGAHCISKFKPNQLKVRAGEWDTQTEKERLPYQERDVVQFIVHEKFQPQTLHNDVALLILSNPFNDAENVGTICLPKQNQIIDSNRCFASGWGKDIFGKAGQYQVILKKIELPIVRHDECQEYLRQTRLGRFFELDKSFTCAGGEAGKDACTGDGGSPLVCPDPENPMRYVQAGIVAWGIGCGEFNIPGVYADVSRFRIWIDEQVERLNLDTTSYI